MDLRFLVMSLTVVLAQVSLLIETHELSVWIRENRAFCLVEVIGLGETFDPSLDKRIPGAKHLQVKDILDPLALPGVRIPKLETFKAQMKSYGITKDTIAVLYDRGGMRFASMVWWIMSLYGRADKTAVLNGGMPKWTREGQATQTGLPPALLNPALQNDVLYSYLLDPKKLWTSADIDSMQTTPQPFIQVLDVRARSDYVQLSIKSSVNMPIDIINRADGALRSTIELKSIFEGYHVKVTNDYLTVVVSATGIDASVAILALAVIGKGNCALLDGGWTEYVNWLKTKDAPPLSPPVIVQPVPAGPQPGSIKAAGCVNCAVETSLSVPASFRSCWERCSSFCPDPACESRCSQSFCEEAPAAMPAAQLVLALTVVAGVVLYFTARRPSKQSRC